MTAVAAAPVARLSAVDEDAPTSYRSVSSALRTLGSSDTPVPRSQDPATPVARPTDGFEWLNHRSLWHGGYSAFDFHFGLTAGAENNDAKFLVPDAKGFEKDETVQSKQPPPLVRKQALKRWRAEGAGMVYVDPNVVTGSAAAATTEASIDGPKVKKHKH